MPAISLVESNVCIVLIAWGTGAGGSESLYCGEVVPQCFSLSFIFGKGEG